MGVDRWIEADEETSQDNETMNRHMGVSKNMGKPPKSSILIGFSIINHPFWGFSPYFWKHLYTDELGDWKVGYVLVKF